jgi:hypothetical protein
MKRIAKMSAHGSTELSKLLKAFPDKLWNVCCLNGNPNITMKDVQTYPKWNGHGNYWEQMLI